MYEEIRNPRLPYYDRLSIYFKTLCTVVVMKPVIKKMFYEQFSLFSPDPSDILNLKLLILI